MALDRSDEIMFSDITMTDVADRFLYRAMCPLCSLLFGHVVNMQFYCDKGCKVHLLLQGNFNGRSAY